MSREFWETIALAALVVTVLFGANIRALYRLSRDLIREQEERNRRE